MFSPDMAMMMAMGGFGGRGGRFNSLLKDAMLVKQFGPIGLTYRRIPLASLLMLNSGVYGQIGGVFGGGNGAPSGGASFNPAFFM